MAKQWKSIVIFVKGRFQAKVLKIVLPQVLELMLSEENQKDDDPIMWNYCHYPDHISVRIYAEQEIIDKIHDSIPCKKKRIQEYEERWEVIKAYCTATRTACTLGINPTQEILAHLIHGMLNNFGYGYIAEMKLLYSMFCHDFDLIHDMKIPKKVKYAKLGVNTKTKTQEDK